jgi:outer membrane protein
MKNQRFPRMCLALCLSGAAGSSALAADSTVYAGAAAIRFNVDSTDLTGPAGTTPPGIKIDVDNASTLALVYTTSLGGDFSVSLLAGTPPKLRFKGAGNAAALGEVGSARTWFPAVTVDYSIGNFGGVRPFVGAGVNYATFTQAQVNSTFTSAFGGTSSSTKLKAGVGAVWRLGVDIPLSDKLVLQASAARYLIKTKADVTTETPGVGPITRSLTLRSDPDVFAVMLGYRF